ncbi:MAG: hypothetical protein NTX11_02690 [Candidatus Saccharibacteria bacterium]|nr:hypothetical protein [Candidatus Saccharibacteria bacterium]
MAEIRQLTMDARYFTDEIVNRGFAEIVHGIRAEEFDTVVSAYARLTSGHPDPEPGTMDAMLPKYDDLVLLGKSLDVLDRSADKQKIWHKYRTNVEGIGKPDGYSNRYFQEHALRESRGVILNPPEDNKEFYHFTPGLYAKMVQNHEMFGWGPIPSEVAALNNAFGPIHKKATELMIKVCGLIEETHPEINSFVTLEALRTSPIRLLFYHRSDAPQLGAKHVDKSAVTAQLAESHRGLRIAPGANADLVEVDRDSTMAAIFPGTALEDKFPGTPFQPTSHDIVSANVLNEGRRIPPDAEAVCARWAIISFANYVNFVNPDKSLTHAV